MEDPDLQTLIVRKEAGGVVILELARESHYNAISPRMWDDFTSAFKWIDQQDDVRSVSSRNLQCSKVCIKHNSKSYSVGELVLWDPMFWDVNLRNLNVSDLLITSFENIKVFGTAIVTG